VLSYSANAVDASQLPAMSIGLYRVGQNRPFFDSLLTPIGYKDCVSEALSTSLRYNFLPSIDDLALVDYVRPRRSQDFLWGCTFFLKKS